MKIIYKIIIIAIGYTIKRINKFYKPNKAVWVFGGQEGYRYGDNSKYFYEFICNNYTDVNAIWITRSRETLLKIRQKGFKAYHNLSLKGIRAILRASVIVFCTSRNDVWFAFPKKNRVFVNLWHGMPMKKIAFDYPMHRPEKRGLKGKIWNAAVAGFGHQHVNLISATSKFYAKILASAFQNPNVFITGQPRTDVFYHFSNKAIREKLGFSLEDKIVTYMPTHRGYGKGKLNPRIFFSNDEAIQYFKNNKIKVIWKYHKNMLKQYLNTVKEYDEATFLDLTISPIDTQELLYITDILITDYSSCYVDFLLLEKPIIFYIYDNYDKEDNELYFTPEDVAHNNIANNEHELLEKIKNPPQAIKDISKFHKYTDDQSSQRILTLINNLISW